MQVKEITDLIEEYAPLSLQESYDNAGLICGDFTNEITSILLCTDITEQVIDEAIDNGNNLILSHHPLTLQGVKNLCPDSYAKRCLIKAIKENLNIYSAHTNMDAVYNGVSGRMADKLGLINRKILQPEGKLFCLTFYTPEKAASEVREAIWKAGGGHIGNYSHCSYNVSGEGTFLATEDARPYCGTIGELHREKEIRTEITIPDYLLTQCIQALRASHPYEEPVWNIVCLNNTNPASGFGIIGELPSACETLSFLEKIKTIFQCQMIRHTSICKPQLKTIALCGGSGAFLTSKALACNADLYISGDFKYHDFFNTENRIILADIGHYESEQYTKEIFYELVIKKMPKFAVQFSEVNTNPINYL